MQKFKLIRKIGRSAWFFPGIFLALQLSYPLNCSGQAASSVQFKAEVDKSEVSLDDTVTLTLDVSSEGQSVSDPQFDAPDFDVVGSSNSISVESYYDMSQSGQSGAHMIRHHQQIRVLRPHTVGKKLISKIQVSAGGNVYHSPDVTVNVVAGGGAGGHSANTGGMGNMGNIGNVGPRGRMGPSVTVNGGKGSRDAEKPGFIQAELDKKTAYKGEQLVLSYYLYHRGKVFNLQVDKFPILSGFWRKDLDMPIFTQRLESQQVMVNGVPYLRTLLGKYAAYPIEEGDLTIDSISIRFNYYPRVSQSHGSSHGQMPGEEDDPFFSFFQQLAPRAGSAQSEKIKIHVLPLPDEGRPKSFSGGVGDFSLSSQVDRYEVHANEAINLVLKVEGRGSPAAIQLPKVSWPSGLELFESKGKDQVAQDGSSAKIFELLLIPRNPGKYVLPPIEMGFFDPQKKEYYTKSTSEMTLNVLDPLPGTQTANPLPQVVQSQVPLGASTPQGSSMSTEPAPSGLKMTLSGVNHTEGFFLWKLLGWGCVAAFFIFIGLIGFDEFKAWKRQKPQEIEETPHLRLKQMKHALAAGRGGAGHTLHTYDQFIDVFYDALELRYGVNARSLARDQLGQILVGEKGMSNEVWSRIHGLLDRADFVRFASGAGPQGDQPKGQSDQQQYKADLLKWVTELEEVLVRGIG